MGISVDLGKIKFNWRGDWSPSTAYTKDDVVNYNGASVVCVANNTGQTPNIGGNTSYWNVMLKGDGSFATSAMNNPQKTFRSQKNLRRRYYDYSEPTRNLDNTVNPYSMEQMWNDGRFTNSGITNSTSHLTTSPWNGRQMIEVGYQQNNFNYGPLITVPANTDVMQVYGHGGSNDVGQIFSLTDPSTGKGVCYNGCGYDNRYYTMFGWHTGGSALPEFGKVNGTNYYGSSMFMVPRLSYDKQYRLVRGHHGRNMSWSGWVAGISFQDNPSGFVWQPSGSQYERFNGGDVIWHSSWNSNEMAQMYIHYDNARTVKVPVAPRNNAPSGDRVLFFMYHAEGHDQQLKHCLINNKVYHLRTDVNHPVKEYLYSAVNQSHKHWKVALVVVPEEDIPSAVRTGGGVMDVYLDNSGISQDSHNSHHWYWGLNGTCYLEPESTTIDDGRTGRNAR